MRTSRREGAGRSWPRPQSRPPTGRLRSPRELLDCPYTLTMPTPVGPVPSDPDDPDLWDWSGDDDEDFSRPTPRWSHVMLVGVVVFALVLLVLVSVL